MSKPHSQPWAHWGCGPQLTYAGHQNLVCPNFPGMPPQLPSQRGSTVARDRHGLAEAMATRPWLTMTQQAGELWPGPLRTVPLPPRYLAVLWHKVQEGGSRCVPRTWRRRAVQVEVGNSLSCPVPASSGSSSSGAALRGRKGHSQHGRVLQDRTPAL